MCRLFFRKKKIQPKEHFLPDENKGTFSAHQSGPVSANPAEAGNQQKTRRCRWGNRLFGYPERKESDLKEDGKIKENDSTLTKTPDPNHNITKTHWWQRLFRCCKRRHRVAPAPHNDREKDERQRSRPGMPKEEAFGSFDRRSDNLESMRMELLMLELLLNEKFNSTKRSCNNLLGGVRRPCASVDRFGFPNIGQSCYINSSLQSLLTLEDFVSDVSRQEGVWSSVREAQLLRQFMAIRDAHTSKDSQSKSHLLNSFKEVVSVHAPEFSDHQQKDAHEFLTSVLDQMRNLSPVVRNVAAHMGRTYTCPVEDHLLFKMETTRTCKRCGAQSKTQEEFTNLSLDLVPGGSVELILKEYLAETEVEYKCECGGNTSCQRTTFEMLPRVLILHLKRFSFTTSNKLVKLHDPVVLLRDLVVPSKHGCSCYSLVTAISHFGSTEEGHYICDSIHPEACPDEPADRWLTFNDAEVRETSSVSVCSQRQEAAYILFYKRKV